MHISCTVFNTASGPQIPLYRNLKPGTKQHLHWQTDVLTTRLDLIRVSNQGDPDPGFEKFDNADPDPGCEEFADPDLDQKRTLDPDQNAELDPGS